MNLEGAGRPDSQGRPRQVTTEPPLLQFNITGTCLNDSDDDSPDLDVDGNEGPLALLMSNGR